MRAYSLWVTLTSAFSLIRSAEQTMEELVLRGVVITGTNTRTRGGEDRVRYSSMAEETIDQK